MKKKRVQVKGRFRKNMVVFLGVMMVFCVAGAVQAGQPPVDPSRFSEVAGSSGTIVRDNNTGLEWQRCPYGQSWTGSGCSGAAWEGKWEDAMRVTASGGFRIPTFDELKTLAPYDQKVFPGAYAFWSSTFYASNSSRAWLLDFNYGGFIDKSKSHTFQLRLVRVGQQMPGTGTPVL